MLQYINPIKIYVVITLIFALGILNRKNKTHRYLLFILFVCLTTEIVNTALKYNGLSIRVSYSVSIIFHHSLWIMALSNNIKNKKTGMFLLYCFIVFAVLNIVFVETVNKYNYYTFVFGAIIYITLFINESYRQLKNENLSYFISNNFLLLFAPLLFFFGLSIMFGFKTAKVTSSPVFIGVSLYNFIINIVEAANYLLLNIYIFRESRYGNK